MSTFPDSSFLEKFEYLCILSDQNFYWVSFDMFKYLQIHFDMFKMMIGIFSGNYEAFFKQYEDCIAVLRIYNQCPGRFRFWKIFGYVCIFSVQVHLFIRYIQRCLEQVSKCLDLFKYIYKHSDMSTSLQSEFVILLILREESMTQ